ncbi:hypothetical protein, partial [Phaeodactylibacter luteus]|uniref:hypothetical protein n=1 Tax=Phaeodactylibacter luteus TaxID=1564516 RepID=UPI00147869D8
RVFVVAAQQLQASPDTTVLACAPVTEALCFTASGAGLPVGLLEWADAAGTVLGSGGELCVAPPAGDHLYIVSAPGLSCIISDTVRVQVEEEMPPLPENLRDTFGLCVGEELRIDLSGYGHDYTWTGCDGSPGAVSGGELIVVGASEGEQCYTFEATNGCGSTSLEVRVFVVAAQQLQASPDTTVLACAPVTEALCFTASGAGL